MLHDPSRLLAISLCRLRARLDRRVRFVAILVATSAVAPTVVEAQVRPPDEPIPHELVAALLGTFGADVPRIVVGALPGGLPFDLPVPDRARAVGGMERRGGATVVLHSPDSREAGLAIVRAAFEAAGWSAPPPREVPEQRGFATSGSGYGGPTPTYLCHDDGSVTL